MKLYLLLVKFKPDKGQQRLAFESNHVIFSQSRETVPLKQEGKIQAEKKGGSVVEYTVQLEPNQFRPFVVIALILSHLSTL
jgi:hypothetical protein